MLQIQYREIAMRAELYAKRLEELGWTKYRLAQEVLRIRQQRGETVTFQSIESAVRKALANPDKASAQANDDLVEAMNGEVVIRWQSYKEVKI
jgi:hypothetical protein